MFVYNDADCRNNGKIQEFYHPGLFVNSKWTCCDHKSKHSYGCTRSFVSIENQIPDANVPPPMGGGIPANRKPLPPTPMDNIQHTTPNNFGGSGPNMGMGGGGMGVGSNHAGGPKNSQYFGHVPDNLKKGNNHISSYSHHNPGMEPSSIQQPPAPVSLTSIQWLLPVYMVYIIT